MKHVIICGGCVRGEPGPVGQYLKRYNPEAFDGRGDAEWTDRLEEALRFDTFGDALRLWRAVPSNHPVRASDGKPNRPLTAFTVTIEPEDGDHALVRRVLAGGM